ncbi:MAG: AAA family ATPase, partial [Desulfobacteraceae bacterium]|nr:AAA family ATPase [Desulfobacteraceae bacterium]
MMQDFAGGGTENELFAMGDTPASHDHDAAAQLLLFLQNGIADGGARPDGKAGLDLHILQSCVKKELLIPGQTLLFFDEIQACPRALMALRYFHEEMPELHVIAAGSLLEFAFGEISIPVGRVQYLHMHPMTFYEYLL